MKTTEERFWTKVDKSGTCWLWIGALDNHGYGRIGVGCRVMLVHRLSLTLAGTELIDGLVVDHLCRVRNCVNPEHLEQVTQRLNTARGVHPLAVLGRENRGSCGHSLSESDRGPSGKRRCRECHAAHARKQTALLVAAAHSLGLSKADYVRANGHSIKTAFAIAGGTQ